jgi:hypothetical protein
VSDGAICYVHLRSTNLTDSNELKNLDDVNIKLTNATIKSAIFIILPKNRLKKMTTNIKATEINKGNANFLKLLESK